MFTYHQWRHAMKGYKLSLCVGVMVLCWTGLLLAHEQTEKLGHVHFPLACSAPAQQHFDRAVALLHSFWYAEAVKAFTTVTETDPGCVRTTKTHSRPRYCE